MAEAILKASPKRALEIGCGGGNMSIYLSQAGVEALGIDIEEAVVEEARRHNRALGGRADFRVGDGFATGFADQSYCAVHSQGVLEHFDDKDIEAFLAEGIRVARRSVHSVPNLNYPTKDFGNERLMPARFWQARGVQAGQRAGRKVSVQTVDYRRRFSRQHLANSLINTFFNRYFFTLLVIDVE